MARASPLVNSSMKRQISTHSCTISGATTRGFPPLGGVDVMQVGEAIVKRRSIRRFQDKPIPRQLVEQVLEAATLAPSGKNAQPWEFIVLEGAARDKLPELITAGAEKVEAMGYSSGSAKNSARILEESKVIIVVYNPNGKANEDGNEYHRAMRSVDTQSVGAAI